MHFLDAWSELSPFDWVRLLAPVGFLAAGTFLPGGRVARLAAIGVAAGIPLLRELAVLPWAAGGWTLLWLWIGWRAEHDDQDIRGRPRATGRGAFESGTVGLLLGFSVLALLIAAVARQDMSPEDGRRASYGATLLALGLIHLMLRRHLRRAAMGLAALGLGLQVLDGAARGAQVQMGHTRGMNGAGILLATFLAIALVSRLAVSRQRHAGSAWISDAHDLHD